MSYLTRCAAAAVAAAVSMSSAALGQTLLAGWTMPSAFPTGTGNVPTGTFYRPPLAVNPDGTFNANPNTGGTQWDPALAGRADQGVFALQAGFELSSSHQLASSGPTPTSYTSPAGNGSAYAFSSNVWSIGDYYSATFRTTGYTNISFSWDMTRSSTGPATWAIEMSVNGGVFQVLNPSFSPIVAGAAGSGTTSWSTNPANYQAAFTNTLSLGAAADSADSVTIRIRALVDPVNGSGAYQAGGTARIDNVLVTGVPAPGAVALLGLAGLAARRRRR
jgi:MYXO-CTERM domain-containing protein